MSVNGPIIARFDVTGWNETPLPGVEEGWAQGAVLPKTFTSGLTGSSVALFISSGSEEGKRAYIAAERITGQLEDGRSGSFTVHHGGLESNQATWFGHIVPASGTGDFAEWEGSARIEHDDVGAFFSIELTSQDAQGNCGAPYTSR